MKKNISIINKGKVLEVTSVGDYKIGCNRKLFNETSKSASSFDINVNKDRKNYQIRSSDFNSKGSGDLKTFHYKSGTNFIGNTARQSPYNQRSSPYSIRDNNRSKNIQTPGKCPPTKFTSRGSNLNIKSLKISVCDNNEKINRILSANSCSIEPSKNKDVLKMQLETSRKFSMVETGEIEEESSKNLSHLVQFYNNFKGRGRKKKLQTYKKKLYVQLNQMKIEYQKQLELNKTDKTKIKRLQKSIDTNQDLVRAKKGS